MKAKFVLLVLLLPIFSTMSVSAQIPTAAISMTCDTNFEHDYIYTETLTPFLVAYVNCTASNPTNYQEKISVTVIAPGLATAAPGDMYVGGGQDVNFQVTIRDIIGKSYYEYICDSCVEIIAKVEEIQSATPPNNATSVNVLGIKVNSMVENSTIGMPMPALDGQIYNGQQWDNYDYSMLFNDSSSSPFEQPWTAVQFMATDCPYCHSMAADMYEWSNLFDPTNQTNDNPKVNFFASATKLNTEATMELSWTNADGTESNGTVVFELFHWDAPMHVENFAILAENGDYDGTVFHRIISDFMMQGGDFTTGDGSGGHAGKFFGYCNGLEVNSADDCSITSYTVPDEADNGRNHLPYSLSMAKTSQPNTGGSQFFIVDPDTEAADGSPGTPHLNGVHTVFGEVTSGFEHIDAITSLCDPNGCEGDKTPQDVVLESATTNFFQGQSDIVSFRDSYNHSFPYINDLDNDNMNSWNILGMPSYSLIQPNEIIAWNSDDSLVYWNHSSNRPAQIDLTSGCGLISYCQLDDIIFHLVDHNHSTTGSFDSNSTQLSITEIGPFSNSVKSYMSSNGTEYPVVFLKESFHIDASLSQFGGQGLENKCLNIYIDPDENPIPITTIQTDENGVIEWYSNDPLQNPSLKGIETTNGKLEGLRTLRVSYEPEQDVTGGCDEDLDSQTSGSYSEVEILVQSRVDIQVVNSWSYFGENAQYEGSQITGEVILLRDRLDLVVENEEIIFSRQYISPNSADWITDYENISTTDELGKAEFNWTFDGKTCSNEPCSGVWRVVAYYPGSFLFAPSQNNISFEIHTKDSVDSDGDGVSDHLDEFPDDANETHDDDGDGVGNNTDAFPQDANETMDTDGDGVGDNADVEPDNPDVRYSDDIKVEISDRSSYIIAGAIVFLALVILFVRRKQPPINDTHSQFAYEESLFKDN